MAFKDEFDMLIAITGDRDFKDCFYAVATEANKPVKVCGFDGSLWQGYYEPDSGCEVLAAEYFWDRAIGKSLKISPKIQEKMPESSKNIELSSQYPSKNITTAPTPSYNSYYKKRGGGKRRAGYSNSRSENNYYDSYKSSKKGKKNHNKILSGKYAQLDLNNIDDSKSACNVILNSGKYFESVIDESKKNLVSNFKVDDFIAELALYITDGNEEASKAFLTRK